MHGKCVEHFKTGLFKNIGVPSHSYLFSVHGYNMDTITRATAVVLNNETWEMETTNGGTKSQMEEPAPW